MFVSVSYAVYLLVHSFCLNMFGQWKHLCNLASATRTVLDFKPNNDFQLRFKEFSKIITLTDLQLMKNEF